MKLFTSGSRGHVHLIGLIFTIVIIGVLVTVLKQFDHESELEQRIGSLEHSVDKLQARFDVLERALTGSARVIP